MRKPRPLFKKGVFYELVAKGDGWLLYWPTSQWFSLSKEERAKVIARHTKIEERRRKAEQKKAARKRKETQHG